jgi:hypothetical protein
MPKKRRQPWVANFDEAGNATLTPDTPETRAQLNLTLHLFHSGGYKDVRPVWKD